MLCRHLLRRLPSLRSISTDLTWTSEKANYPGVTSNITNELQFINPLDLPTIPTYRVMGQSGSIVKPEQIPDIPDDYLVSMYKTMFLLSQMDKILLQSQRQGRISFYMTSSGEESAIIGTAAALDNGDTIFTQYREVGVFLWRGFTLNQIMHQCFSTTQDNAKGRQMPIHYSAKNCNIQCVSSTLGTQVPNAVGYAYANRIQQKNQVSLAFFGEGAASEGDIHAAMNMAATLSAPVLFVCRNNGYAISTGTADQYKGDGIAVRGIGYGIVTVRVDGNDIFAVFNAVKEAREIALKKNCPVLIELMTYRVGHHSTSDDSTAYRSIDEVEYWHKEDSPVGRFSNYLVKKGLWNHDQQIEFSKQCRKEVLLAFKEAETTKKPDPYWMFDDVYEGSSVHLSEQKEELRQHLEKYGKEYSLENYNLPVQ